MRAQRLLHYSFLSVPHQEAAPLTLGQDTISLSWPSIRSHSLSRPPAYHSYLIFCFLRGAACFSQKHPPYVANEFNFNRSNRISCHFLAPSSSFSFSVLRYFQRSPLLCASVIESEREEIRAAPRSRSRSSILRVSLFAVVCIEKNRRRAGEGDEKMNGLEKGEPPRFGRFVRNRLPRRAIA